MELFEALVDSGQCKHCVQTLVSFYPQVQRHPAPSRQGSDGEGSSWWEAAWAMLPSSPSTYSYTYTSSTVEEVISTVHIIFTLSVEVTTVHYRLVWWRRCPGRRRGCGWRRRWP